MISNYFEVVAIREHRPIHQSQLAFKKGEKILVLETASTGWWRGEVNGKKGLFPQSYVTPTSPSVSSPQQLSQQQQSQSNDSNTSSNSSPSISTYGVNTTTTNIPSPTVSNNSNSNNSTTHPPPISTLTTKNTKSETSSSSSSSTTTVDGGGGGIMTPITISVTSQQSNSSSPKGQSTSSTPPHVNLSPKLSSSSSSTSSTPINSKTNNSSSSSPAPPTFLLSTVNNNNNISSNSTNNNKNNTQSPSLAPNTNIKSHTRKNSGPSTTTVENNQSTMIGQQPDKFKTLPSNHLQSGGSGVNKVRLPIPQFSPNHRISIQDINIDVPYYIARVKESYSKVSYDELDINQGDLVIVYNSKDINSDWWFGKIKSNTGIFPKRLVEIIKDISPSPGPLSPLLPPTQQQVKNDPININTQVNHHQQQQVNFDKAIAITSYNSQLANYLSFQKGDEMILIRKEGDFWMARINNNNQIGLVSPNYILELNKQTNNNNNNQQHLQQQQQQQQQINSPVVEPIKQTNIKTQQKTQTPPPLSPKLNNNSPPQQQQEQPTTPKSEKTEEEIIIERVRASLEHLTTREELLDAIQSLSIKFVRQTAALKKELYQERTLKLAYESELLNLKELLSAKQQNH
eukprot:gene3110-3889_t